MPLPPASRYTDADLWPRLDRAIREEVAKRGDWLSDGHFSTIEDAREKVGYLKALSWVLQTALDLNKAERDNERGD